MRYDVSATFIIPMLSSSAVTDMTSIDPSLVCRIIFFFLSAAPPERIIREVINLNVGKRAFDSSKVVNEKVNNLRILRN